MPVSVKRIAESGALAFFGKCDHEGCGADASFGTELNLREALNALEAGDKETAKQKLGKRWCAEHFQAARASR